MAVLSFNPTPQIIPGAVIVKYIVLTFICCLQALALAFCIYVLNHIKSSEIV
jgi:hypothetical protein